MTSSTARPTRSASVRCSTGRCATRSCPVSCGRAPAGRPGLGRGVPGRAADPVRDAVIRLVQDELVVETMNRAASRRPGRGRGVGQPLRGPRGPGVGGGPAGDGEVQTRRCGVPCSALLRRARGARRAGDLAPPHQELDGEVAPGDPAGRQSPVLTRMLDGVQSRVLIAMRSTSLTGGVGPGRRRPPGHLRGALLG